MSRSRSRRASGWDNVRDLDGFSVELCTPVKEDVDEGQGVKSSAAKGTIEILQSLAHVEDEEALTLVLLSTVRRKVPLSLWVVCADW